MATSGNNKKMMTFCFQNKFVSAAYFNMAFTNFEKTIQEVISKFVTEEFIKRYKQKHNQGYSEKNKLEWAFDTFKDGLNSSDTNSNPLLCNEKQTEFKNLLFHHFPILKPITAKVINLRFLKPNVKNCDKTSAYNELMMNGNNQVEKGHKKASHGISLTECFDILENIYHCLEDSRNHFSHYKPYQSNEKLKKMCVEQGAVSRYLKEVYKASAREVKMRKKYSTQDMNFVNDAYIKASDGTNYYTSNPEYYFSIVGESYIHEDGDNYFQREDYEGSTSFTKNMEKQGLSDFGLLFLCSCFISREYCCQYVEQAKLFKDSPYPLKNNNIILDMLSIFKIRLSKGKRLDINDDETSIALDMLNELNRCPMPLYNLLSPEGRAAFEDKVTRPNEKTPEISLRIRHTDRFPYLALRAIDETKMLNKIRFQVQLGSYRFRFYDKACIDGTRQLRCMSKDINGFGRLQVIENLRKESWSSTALDEQEDNKIQRKELLPVFSEDEELTYELEQPIKDKANNKPYITDHHASYNIHNNRIGLYWETGNENANKYLKGEELTYLPQLKYILVERAGKKVEKADIKQLIPRCSLSIYELVPMLFYHYLYTQYRDEIKGVKCVEEIIIEKHNNLIRFFKEVESSGSESFILDVQPTLQSDLSIEERNKQLKELLQVKLNEKNYKLLASEIPETLKECFCKKINTPKISDVKGVEVGSRLLKVSRSLDWFKRAKEQTERKDNKYGKKQYVEIRHGKLADLLAQSIVDWLPKDARARKKLTGLNYRKLQAALATFDGKTAGHMVSDIWYMMRQAYLLFPRTQENGKYTITVDGHPFLINAMKRNPKNIEDLYYIYLWQEKYHLCRFLDIFQNGKQLSIDGSYQFKGDEAFALKKDINLLSLPFIHPEQDKWKKRDDAFCKNLAKRYQEHIELPDGLFKKQILDLFHKIPECKELLHENIKEDDCNISHLVNLYLEHVLHDSSQSYYGESDERFFRTYGLFNSLYGERYKNETLPKYYSWRQIMDMLHCKEARASVLSDINSFVENMTNKGVYKDLEEAKKKKKVSMMRDINDVMKNEKLIRQYKTQDIILFLIAKLILEKLDVLKDDSKNNSSKTETIEPESIWLGITQPMNFDQTEGAQTKAKSGFSKMLLSDVFEGDVLNRKILHYYLHKNGEQCVNIASEIHIKDFGKTFKTMNDARFKGLIKLLLDSVDQGADATRLYYLFLDDIIKEYQEFDYLRPEAFMKLQELERKAFPLLQNPNSDDSMEFRTLMKTLMEKGSEILISKIRNSFAHGQYNVNYQLLNIDKQSTDFKAPKVSKIMMDKIDQIAKNINK